MNTAALRALPDRVITVDGAPVQVQVRASRTARMIRLRVGPEHPLEMIVPTGTRDERIDQVLAQRTEWIARKLTASRRVSERTPTLGLERPGVVWMDAQPFPVELTGAVRPQARLVRGVIRVDGPPKCAQQALNRWYRREARRRLHAMVQREALRLQVDYASISVRDQRTRWASCSSANNLGFNWRLVIAPEAVQRYVVVHELCHVRVRNHTKQFWRLLDLAMPDWRDHAAWLREHGQELRAYAVRL